MIVFKVLMMKNQHLHFNKNKVIKNNNQRQKKLWILISTTNYTFATTNSRKRQTIFANTFFSPVTLHWKLFGSLLLIFAWFSIKQILLLAGYSFNKITNLIDFFTPINQWKCSDSWNNDWSTDYWDRNGRKLNDKTKTS